MAITLTLTATNPTPAEADLPVNVSLTATAVDSDDSGAIFAFSWHIIDKPPTSTAALDDRRNQNPNLNGIDVWGSYRLFCIAQNTTSGVTSEQDPLAATADSFIDIEVLSTARSLVKPAKAQRNWHTRYWELVDVVEHLEAGMTDATFTTSGAVEIATSQEIATVAGVNDSSSGTSFLAVTTEQLSNVLHSNDANGTLPSGTNNVLRDKVKDTALEKMNEVSITELADVNTTTNPPTAGQALIWSPTTADDSGDNDVGAWIPGDIGGTSALFGVGLCSGETLDGGDILIYDANCLDSEVAIQPGWHARNRNNGSAFALNFPFASHGRATSTWMAAAESASLGTWDDNTEAVGQVAIASLYNTARGRAYDADVYTTTSAITTAMGLGTLPSFTMSPLNFVQSLIGTNFVGPNGTILNIVNDINKDGDRFALYDPVYHTTQEIADLVADAAANTTFDGTAVNLIQQALSTHQLLRLGRTSITRLADVDTATHAPANGDLLYWDATATDDSGDNQTGAWVPKSVSEIGISGGGSSDGSQFQIQLADASNGFQAANWSINASHHILPSVNDSYDIGSSSFKVRDLYLGANSLHLDTNTLGADSGNLKWNSTFTIPHYSGTPSENQILKWDGSSWALSSDNAGTSGSSSVGDAQDIQLSDGSGGFIAANWNISTGDDLLPEVTNSYDIGSSTKRVKKLWAYDASFADDVTVGDDLTVTGNASIVGSALFGDFANIGDNGDVKSLLLTAGLAGSAAGGNITMSSDEVVVKAETANTQAKLSLQDESGDKVSLMTQQKQGASHIIELPSSSGDAGEVLTISSASTGVSTCEFQKPINKLIFSTHVTREVAGEASFTAGSMNTYVDSSQACIFWIKNTTGNPFTLKQTHIHIGEMRNVSLSFSLCKAASDSAAIANTWTQVGSAFTLNNSSGSDNVLGQSVSTQSTTTTINDDEYLGLCVTDIPASNRNDKRIVITFECEQDTYFS